jgi:hypothetical protein
VAFSDTAGTKRTLLLGGKTIDGSAYYAKTADKADVYLVSNTIVEPLRSWFDAPPKVVPTATPLLPTIGPTQEVTGTGTITGTVLPVGTTTPAGAMTPGAGGTTTPQAQATGTIQGAETITAQQPGAANATTPETTPLLATATPAGAGATPSP